MNKIESYRLFPPCLIAESGLFGIDCGIKAVFLLMEKMIEFVLSCAPSLACQVNQIISLPHRHILVVEQDNLQMHSLIFLILFVFFLFLVFLVLFPVCLYSLSY